MNLEPQGLLYFQNFLTEEYSNEIIKFLDQQNKWKAITGNKNFRRVIHFGYTYSYIRKPLEKTEDIPDIFLPIQKQLKEKTNKNFDQLIINEYILGQGIAPHVD